MQVRMSRDLFVQIDWFFNQLVIQSTLPAPADVAVPYW
jgi:hypothetical protein